MLGSNLQTATSLNNLALLYRTTGKDAAAAQFNAQAIAMREDVLGDSHPDTLASINQLATLHWARGEMDQALALFKRAQRIQSRNTDRFLLSGSDARRQSYLERLSEDTFRNVSFAVAARTPEAIRLALDAVLQYKGRALEVTSDGIGRLRRSVRVEDRGVLERLAEVTGELSRLIYQGRGSLAPQAYLQQQEELAKQQEQLETELSDRSSAFRQQLPQITLERLQTAIPAGAVLVEWLRYHRFDPRGRNLRSRPGEARYATFIVKARGAPVLVDLGDAESIEARAGELLNTVNRPRRDGPKKAAAALSDKLIKPLSSWLQGHTQLLVSPDGMLNRVPVAALLDKSGQYLLEQFEITYVTTGRDLLRFAQGSRARTGAIVVADPDYGSSPGQLEPLDSLVEPTRSAELDSSGLVFRRLAGTGQEAQAIAMLLSLRPQDILLRSEASEERLKQLRGPRILHLATHGFYLQDQALGISLQGTQARPPRSVILEQPLLRSGLALAGANVRRSGRNDDGILTAAEVAQLDLDGTELVVLSACESGAGDLRNGAGVYGLRRALTLAGAQTQLVSHWKVADTATAALMVDYYERLLKGDGRAAALRSVQRAMLANPQRSHPYYWAAFTVVGDWRPLASQPLVRQ
jgi:CHAT domain-containing protein